MEINQGITSFHFPYVPLRIDIQQGSQMVDALLDTGFDGDVALPQHLVAGVLPDGYLPWVLADGSDVLAPAYEGIVQIGSTAPLAAVMIALGEEPLVGRGVSDHFRIVLDHGREIIVEP